VPENSLVVSMLLIVGTICLTVALCYALSLYFYYQYQKKMSSLEKSRLTRAQNKSLRDDAEKWNTKRIEFVNYVKDIMKSSLLNDDAKVGLVLNALLGFYDDDKELEEAAKTWNQALSKNKRKANNVIQSVSQHEANEAPVDLPSELQQVVSRHPENSLIQSKKVQSSEEKDIEKRASSWRGRSKSPIQRPSTKKTMTFQEELLQKLGKIKN